MISLIQVDYCPAALPLARLVVVLLPDVARAPVLLGHVLHHGRPQLVVDALCLLGLRALLIHGEFQSILGFTVHHDLNQKFN